MVVAVFPAAGGEVNPLAERREGVFSAGVETKRELLISK